MAPNPVSSAGRIRLRAPVLLLVLAATAVPVEWRPLRGVSLDFQIFPWDVVANVAGYVPLGLTFVESGLGWAVIAAASLSLFAECSQFAMLHRDPSMIDVAANVLGAFLGAIAGARWRILSPGFRITRWKALVASALALALILQVWAISAGEFNPRGGTAPGALEAHWRLDESHGGVALDSSPNGLNGRIIGRPKQVAGMRGQAVQLDGERDGIDFGRPAALRLFGSMTICAWINSAFYPVDDAAIVSKLSDGFGYQLDTTIDRGPRTIGFKLTDWHGNLMARYGATPLATGAWYHVAGVYDAGARTMDVYLNGKPDNGYLLGPVAGAQRCARAAVKVGQRSDLVGCAFAGSIDDLRIDSRALTGAEIAAAMQGAEVSRPEGPSGGGKGAGGIHPGGRQGDLDLDLPQAHWSDREEAVIPGAAAVLGVLAAISLVGFRPRSSSRLCMAAGLAAGLLLLPVIAPTLPTFNRWLLPLLGLAGGASVALSIDHSRSPGKMSGSEGE